MGTPSRKTFAAGLLTSVFLLLSCQEEAPSQSDPPLLLESEPIPPGAYRSRLAVNGVYQTFAFASGSSVVYSRQKTCLEERDSGAASLRVAGGGRTLTISIQRGEGPDSTYRGRGCPPMVPLHPARITPLGEPFPFRWVDGADAFEIQVSPVAWMRFDKI